MPKAPRIDPVSRPTDGATPDTLRNKDPERHYVLANPNDPHYGVDYMAALGYELEYKRPGGPAFPGLNASADGTSITRLGQVLMSCPMEEYLRRYNDGQAKVDSLSLNIAKHGDADGRIAGPTGRPAYWAEDPSERPQGA